MNLFVFCPATFQQHVQNVSLFVNLFFLFDGSSGSHRSVRVEAWGVLWIFA